MKGMDLVKKAADHTGAAFKKIGRKVGVLDSNASINDIEKNMSYTKAVGIAGGRIYAGGSVANRLIHDTNGDFDIAGIPFI